MNATTTRFLEIMRNQQRATPPVAVSEVQANDTPAVEDNAPPEALPTDKDLSTTVELQGVDLPVQKQPLAQIDEADEADEHLEPWVHVKPRTAAQNAGGRSPKEIIDTMLSDSDELGEPVVLRLPVTPQLAEYLLSLNPDNRNIKQDTLDKYVGDMESGRWQENGEGVAVSNTGLMNNGQHRTTAITICGITQIMNVTVGVTRESRGTNDIGVNKKPGDHLNMAGHSSGFTLGAVARAIISYELAGGDSIGNTKKVTITHLQARVNADPDVIAATTYSVRSQGIMRKHVAGSTIGLVRYLTHKIDPDASNTFLEGFLTGNEDGRGLDINDARYRARETIMNMIKKGNIQDRTEVMMRGWNRWRQGKTVEHNIQVTGRLPKLI